MSLCSAGLPHHKVRPEKPSRQNLDSILRGPKLEGRPFCKADRSQAFSHGAYERSHGRKRPREFSLDRVDGECTCGFGSG